MTDYTGKTHEREHTIVFQNFLGVLKSPKPAYEAERFIIQLDEGIRNRTLAFGVVAVDAVGTKCNEFSV